MGSFALQLINGVSKIVIFLSRADGSVLEAIMPGTEHPSPISSGTMLRPERPIFLSSLSVTNATLARYPLSSSIDRKKNSMTIIGRKLSTEPTPPNIPSTTSERTAPLTFHLSNAAPTLSDSAPMPASSHSCRGAPSTSIVSHITKAMITRKIGSAVHFPVRIWSILRLRLYSLLS